VAIGGCESLNALVLLPKWPFIPHYSCTCTELWYSIWLCWSGHY